MATLGKPAITVPRTGDVRELQQLVTIIRERLAAIDAAIAVQSAASTAQASAPAVSSSATQLAQSFNSISTGLLAKVGANTVAARSISMPVEFEATNASGAGGNPSFEWAVQLPSLVLVSPQGYAGRPEFRALELASDDFAFQGGLGQVLHGNEYGAPFWAPAEAEKITPVAAPTSSLDDGEEGQFAWDVSYLYVCLGPYTWRRVALSSF